MTRIAIRDSTDSYNIDFFDNTNGIKYHLADLEVYAQGSAFLDLKYYSKTQIVDVGMRLAFVFRGKDYWMTVTSVSRESEYEYQIEARSLSLEALREVRSSYKASRNMTFKEYIDVFDPEHSIRLNVNTISDRSRKLEWTGEDTILARILSLATKFDAEIAFETELNDDYSLKEFRLNVHALNELGKDRTGIPFRISNSQLKLIKFKSSIDEFYSAIRGTGKDGLTISGLDKKVYDDEKKLLFYTSGGTIYAPQARDKFISITNKKTSDGYIVREFDNTQHETKEALYAYMLGELKKHCEPQIDYTIDGYIDADVNDKVLLIDDKYTTDDLMLTARVNKQKWSLIDKLQGNNRTELANYVRVYSEIADELITRMNALIEANKVFDVQILTTNGYSFKNGFGETTLTARVMDGPKDVTNEFSLTWFKNSTEYARTASINVQAGSIDELATYVIIAEKDGRERGRNELTVFNVKDGSPGKTPVVHLAWADSADGSVGFSLELPTTKIPKYRGYYVDYSTEASTNPKVYKWERNPDDAAKVADEAKDKADAADSKADSAMDTANSAKDTADEASKQTALVNGLANAAKELADKAKADAAEANRLLGLANTEISKLNTNVNNVRSDLSSAETELNSKIETVKTTLTQDYATKTNLSETQLTLNKTITDSVASVKQEMSEKYAVKSDLTTLQGEYNSFKEETAKKISQQVSSIETIQTNTTEAQKLAGEAYNKAQSAATSATNASSTANSALDKASNATNVANSASQNATNAVANANAAVSAANTAKNNADKAIADVAALTKTVSSQSTRIDQTSGRIDLVASSVTEVGNKIDNLKVGGENLFIDAAFRKKGLNLSHHSSYIPGAWMAYNNHSSYKFGEYDNLVNYLQFTSTDKANLGITQFYDTEILQSGKEFRVRFYTMCETADYNISVIINKKFSNGSFSWYFLQPYEKIIQKSSDLIEHKIAFTIPENDDGIMYGVTLMNKGNSTSNGHTIKMVKPKLEEGNTYTDFSISTKDMATQDDLTNNYYSKTQTDAAIKVASDNVTTTVRKEVTTEITNVNNKVDNLSIGSDNLIINGGFPNDTHGWKNEGSGRLEIRKHDFYFNSKKNMFCIITNKKVSGSEVQEEDIVYSEYFNVKPNTYYTLSFVGFSSSNVVSTEVHYMGKINKDDGSYSNIITLFSKAQMPNSYCQYYQYTFNSGNSNVGSIRFDNNGSTDGNDNYMFFGEVMLVEGTVAKKYQPSSADMATLTQYTEVKQLADRISSTVYDSSTGLTTKVNQLAGKYAITALNSAGDILASLNLNANTSTAEINAKLIRLNGSTKMDDAFVNKLVANSILTNKIKATEISGNYIKGGKITGVSVETNSNGATATLNNGSLSLSKTESVNSSTKNYRYGFIEPNYILMNTYEEISGASPKLTASTWFDANGFYNNTKDSGGVLRKRSILFNSEGIAISPENIYSTNVVNEGNSRNTGIRLHGRRAYLDLNGNRTGVQNGTVSRIISEPNGNMEIINYVGNIYLTTKNGENPVSNGYKIPYTFADGNMGIRIARIANPTSSGAYLELSNMVGKAWGVSMWASDQRLKSNIQSPTQDALDTLNQLQVRQFDWKSDNVHEDFGLIAQEVEQVLPNAVFKVGDYYQIKDSGLIPVLIGAVQKLSKKVNLLENIIYNTKGGNLL